MFDAIRVSELCLSALREVGFSQFLADLGPETHCLVPIEFPEELLGANFRKFSVGHDLNMVPRKDQYLVFDTQGGEICRFLRHRFPGSKVLGVFDDVVVDLASRLRDKSYIERPALTSARPVVVFYTPRSGGATIARLLNASGILQPPVIFRGALGFCTSVGYTFSHIMKNVARSRSTPDADIALLLNSQFLLAERSFPWGPIASLINWIVEVDALAISIRRAPYDQAASLAAAMATDIWEYWGETPVVSQDFGLNLDDALRAIEQHMFVFEAVENLLPARNLFQVHYTQLIHAPHRVVKEVSELTGHTILNDLEEVVQRMPRRLRAGEQISVLRSARST